MKADHPRHDVGGRPVERRSGTGQVVLELDQPAVGPQQGVRGEPGRQHALHDQHAFGDHQPFAGRQIGTTIDAVQVAEIVEPRIVGIVNVLNI